MKQAIALLALLLLALLAVLLFREHEPMNDGLPIVPTPAQYQTEGHRIVTLCPGRTPQHASAAGKESVMIPWLISLGVPQRFAKPLLYGLAAVALLLAIFAAVKLHDRQVVQDYENSLQRRAAPATDKAADERAADAIDNAKNAQERHDAIEAQPDQPIAPTSHALACKRLSDAGKRVAACSGPASGH